MIVFFVTEILLDFTFKTSLGDIASLIENKIAYLYERFHNNPYRGDNKKVSNPMDKIEI